MAQNLLQRAVEADLEDLRVLRGPALAQVTRRPGRQADRTFATEAKWSILVVRFFHPPAGAFEGGAPLFLNKTTSHMCRRLCSEKQSTRFDELRG